LFAAKELEKHTMVIEYIGQLIRNEVSEMREKVYEQQVGNNSATSAPHYTHFTSLQANENIVNHQREFVFQTRFCRQRHLSRW